MMGAKYYLTLTLLFVLCGCSNGTETNINEKCIHETKINITESADSHFFPFEPGVFALSEATKQKMSELFRDSRAKGIENVSFLIVSSTPVPVEAQENVKKDVLELMYKFRFMDSRIIDSGSCYYPNANRGIRINMLDYDIEIPDVSEWTDTVGDAYPNKHLPKIGVSADYNLEQMIANKADLLSPRRYKGPRLKDAIEAIGGSVSGSAGGGGSSGGSSGGGSSGKS